MKSLINIHGGVMHCARERNVGHRLFLCLERIKINLKGASILADVYGSDHCPVAIDIKF